jgi:hypothetical protein
MARASLCILHSDSYATDRILPHPARPGRRAWRRSRALRRRRARLVRAGRTQQDAFRHDHAAAVTGLGCGSCMVGSFERARGTSRHVSASSRMGSSGQNSAAWHVASHCTRPRVARSRCACRILRCGPSRAFVLSGFLEKRPSDLVQRCRLVAAVAVVGVGHIIYRDWDAEILGHPAAARLVDICRLATSNSMLKVG